MKIKLILPAIFLTFLCFAQSVDFPVDAETKKITYSEVVQVGKGTKKSMISTRADKWSKAKNYAAKPKQVPGTYATRGSIVTLYPGPTTGKQEKGIVDFVCTIYCKDGKYKYVISNFKHSGQNGRGSGGALENEAPECGKYVMPLASWTKIKQDVHDEMPKIIDELKKAIAATPVVAKKKNPADF